LTRQGQQKKRESLICSLVNCCCCVVPLTHTLSHPQDGFDGGGEVCSDPIVLFEVVRVHRDRGVKVVVVAQNFDEVAEGWFTHQRGVVG